MGVGTLVTLADQKAVQEVHQAVLQAAEQRSRADGLETQLKAAQASAARVPGLEQRIQALMADVKKLKVKKGNARP